MSGTLWRWKKLRDMTTTTSANSAAAMWTGCCGCSVSSVNCNYHNYPQNHNQQRRGLANWLRPEGRWRRRETHVAIGGMQESRYKWEQGGSNSNRHQKVKETRQPRAEPSCPRCTNHVHMDLFSMRRLQLLPPSSSDIPGEDDPKIGTFKEVSVCPNCNTAFFFKPYSTTTTTTTTSTTSPPPPLQGCFVEIGKLKSKPHPPTSHHHDTSNDNVSAYDLDYNNASRINHNNNRFRASFWDTLRSYSNEPPEYWPPPSGNGLAVHTPPGPPFAPGVNVIRASGPKDGSRGGGANGSNNNGNGEKNGRGESNLGKNLPTPKEI